MIPFFVVIPLGAAFIVSVLGRYFKRLSDSFTLIASTCLLAFTVLFLFLKDPNAISYYHVGGWPAPMGITLAIDGLSRLVLIMVNFVAFVITIFSIQYMERFTSKHKFYTLFLLLVAGMNGVIISSDIFNLFVFFEIASISSYALVAFGVRARELEASFKYTIMGVIASLFILLGIAIMYSYASSLNIADISRTIAQKGVNNAVIFVAVLWMIGFGLKGAIVPFHGWLPDAHPAAPAPVSAMLSGVFIKTLGIYTIIRFFYTVFSFNASYQHLFMFLGVLSIIMGGLLALGQTDIKRLLAYSSISQVGYIMLGLGLGTKLGLLGSLFHMFNHSLFKSLLFLNAGAIEYATGTREMDKLGGLRTKLPVTSFSSFIASMSISGIPPFNGFFSKLIIIIACIESNHIGLALWAITGSVLTLAYFTKFQKNVFFGTLKDSLTEVKEVPALMKTAMLLLCTACVISGLLIMPVVRSNLLDPAQKIISERNSYGALTKITTHEQ